MIAMYWIRCPTLLFEGEKRTVEFVPVSVSVLVPVPVPVVEILESVLASVDR